MYDSISSKYISVGDPNFYILFSYTDGEGDLDKILYVDSRKKFLTDSIDTIATPEIKELTGVDDISGKIFLRPVNTLLISPPFDTFYYKIQLQDKAGNLSNPIYTDSIIIQ